MPPEPLPQLRPELQAQLDDVRERAQGRGSWLFWLLDALLRLAGRGAAMRRAQKRYFKLRRSAKASKAETDRARILAQEAEAAYDEAADELGLGEQPALPGME
jgi:hypothetical protein